LPDGTADEKLLYIALEEKELEIPALEEALILTPVLEDELITEIGALYLEELRFLAPAIGWAEALI
jgi:hypothetical protein